VILSSVRKREPGFLRSQPRMNVALTRCKKGMVVVTDKRFLQGAGRSTLLGQLCQTWSQRLDTYWIDWNAMLNNSVALPGLPSSTSQQRPALTRIDEQSRPISTHGFSSGLHPPSRPQTQTHTQGLAIHQTSLSPSAKSFIPGSANVIGPMRRSAMVTATDLLYPSVRNARSPGSGNGIPTATMAVPGNLDDEFPPLPTALDQSFRNLKTR
jgi:hypothetical protein